MNLQENIVKNLEEAEKAIHTYRNAPENINALVAAAELMAESLAQGKKLISCGNGGSMCDAIHFAEELTGRFRESRKSLAAIAISDVGHISCVANDFGYAYIFSRFIESMGQAGDVLVAISTSGNSENVLKAVEAAKEKGMKVVALTGKDGGKLAEVCDIELRAPFSAYADRAQEIHIKIIHCLIDSIEQLIAYN